MYVDCHASNAFLSIFHLSIRSVTHFILLNMTFQGNTFQMLLDLAFNKSINLLFLYFQTYLLIHIAHPSGMKGEKMKNVLILLKLCEFAIIDVILPHLFSVCYLVN